MRKVSMFSHFSDFR